MIANKEYVEYTYNFREKKKIMIVNVDSFLKKTGDFSTGKPKDVLFNLSDSCCYIFWLYRMNLKDIEKFNSRFVTLRNAGYDNFKFFIVNQFYAPPDLKIFKFILKDKKKIMVVGSELGDFDYPKYSNKSPRDLLLYKNLLLYGLKDAKITLHYIKDIKPSIGKLCSYNFTPNLYYDYKYSLYNDFHYDLDYYDYEDTIYLYAPPRAGGWQFANYFIQQKTAYKIGENFFINDFIKISEFMNGDEEKKVTIIIIDEESSNISTENKILIFSHLYLAINMFRHDTDYKYKNISKEPEEYNSNKIVEYYKNLEHIEESNIKIIRFHFIPYFLFNKDIKNLLADRLKFYYYH